MVVAAFAGVSIEPDAGEEIKVLIELDSLADGFEEFRWHVEGSFFSGLERRNGCAEAAGGALIAGFGESGEEGHGNRYWRTCFRVLPGCFGTHSDV